jgi:hypothetical protein
VEKKKKERKRKVCISKFRGEYMTTKIWRRCIQTAKGKKWNKKTKRIGENMKVEFITMWPNEFKI